MLQFLWHRPRSLVPLRGQCAAGLFLPPPEGAKNFQRSRRATAFIHASQRMIWTPVQAGVSYICATVVENQARRSSAGTVTVPNGRIFLARWDAECSCERPHSHGGQAKGISMPSNVTMKRRKSWLLAASALASSSLGISEPALARTNAGRLLAAALPALRPATPIPPASPTASPRPAPH